MSNKGICVIVQDPISHPRCSHGPTLLFSKDVNGQKVNFFACAACRDKKFCNFFLLESVKNKYNIEIWKKKENEFIKDINHKKKFLTLNRLKSMPSSTRLYCHTCMKLFRSNRDKHQDHKITQGINNHHLNNPTEFLASLENCKKEAQFFFSEECVMDIINIFKSLGYRNIICIGTPRIHENIRNHHVEMSSILLDMDKRFTNFFGPLEFCLYNLFNNYFFFEESRQILEDFLQIDNGKDTALILDPPFGGRTEPIIYTLNSINNQYKKLNNIKRDLPIFWIFPYFMEPQILNGLTNFQMLDYKVDYDNHQIFQNGPKGRKQGSPVRIFTNVNASLIKLPEGDYKYCKICKRWVAKENKHCTLCNACTSKDGRTYVHCDLCRRCVKPTWIHCDKCNRCAQEHHKCGVLEFTKECYHCQKPGHKRSECPNLEKKMDHDVQKRKPEKVPVIKKRRKKI